jgi:hypothetical protein
LLGIVIGIGWAFNTFTCVIVPESRQIARNTTNAIEERCVSLTFTTLCIIIEYLPIKVTGFVQHAHIIGPVIEIFCWTAHAFLFGFVVVETRGALFANLLCRLPVFWYFACHALDAIGIWGLLWTNTAVRLRIIQCTFFTNRLTMLSEGIVNGSCATFHTYFVEFIVV